MQTRLPHLKILAALCAVTAVCFLACLLQATASSLLRPQPTPSPNPWRNLLVAQTSQSGDVEVLRMFAATRRDGGGAIACVSFINLSPKVANEIVFEFPLLSALGIELGKLTLDRKGEFSSHIAVNSFMRLTDWQQGAPGPRDRIDNCVQLDSIGAPLLDARLSGYRVVRVRYDDGSTWPPL